MEPVGHPVFDDPQVAQRANLPANAGSNVGLLGGTGGQFGLPAVEEQLAQKQQIAGRIARKVHIHVRLTKEELAAQCRPGIGDGRYQAPTVDRISTNRVRFLQAIQEYGLAQDGRRGITEVQDVVRGLIVVLEGRAALLQGHVELGVFESHTRAIILR